MFWQKIKPADNANLVERIKNFSVDSENLEKSLLIQSTDDDSQKIIDAANLRKCVHKRLSKV